MRNSLFIQGAGSQHLFQQLVDKLKFLDKVMLNKKRLDFLYLKKLNEDPTFL